MKIDNLLYLRCCCITYQCFFLLIFIMYFIDLMLGCLIYELFCGMKLVKTEELRNTACIPKVCLSFCLVIRLSSCIRRCIVIFRSYLLNKIYFSCCMCLFSCLTVSTSRLSAAFEFHAFPQVEHIKANRK